MSVLKRVRLVLAILAILAAMLLFVDVSGAAHLWLGWIAKIQLLPAILALNLGVVVLLVILTLLLGRVYCSVICPLGIFQDVMARFGKMSRKNRYSYSPERKVLRYTFFVLFIATLVGGVSSVAGILEPYSSFGRIASNLFAPVYAWGNNLLAYISERAGSYAFYPREVWVKGIGTFVVAVSTLVVLAVLAWRNGRTYCNTVCPVGTLLGLLSRWSVFAPVIDTEKCISCKICSRNCKSACIDIANHKIDYSRCVVCMDCIDVCPKDAVSFRLRSKSKAAASAPDGGMKAKAGNAKQTVAKVAEKAPDAVSRKGFITGAGLLAVSAVRAQEMKVDGGFAEIIAKKVSKRETRIVPAGAQSLRHLAAHCTGCQLCVEACPNGVLRPSGGLITLLQPEIGFDFGGSLKLRQQLSEELPGKEDVVDPEALRFGIIVDLAGKDEKYISAADPVLGAAEAVGGAPFADHDQFVKVVVRVGVSHAVLPVVGAIEHLKFEVLPVEFVFQEIHGWPPAGFPLCILTK